MPCAGAVCRVPCVPYALILMVLVGRAGKIESWAACRDDAIRRDSFWPLKKRFLQSLPPAEQARLQAWKKGSSDLICPTLY